METMFDTLLQLPLFQGLCHEDFTTILDKVSLHFTKHKTGETILKSGKPCEKLYFLLKGEMSMVTSSEKGLFTFIERIEAPYVIEPHSMFGMNTSYRSSYMAEKEVHTVEISKASLLSELLSYDIFRLNYMNITSNRAQNLFTALWTPPTQTLEEKIIHFILSHTERWQGEKILKAKMGDLAMCLDDTRLNTSKALNNLKKRGVLELRRKEILIPEVQRLLE